MQQIKEELDCSQRLRIGIPKSVASHNLEGLKEKEIKEFYQKDENLNNLYEQLLNDKLFSTLSEFATNKISEKSTKELREGK